MIDFKKFVGIPYKYNGKDYSGVDCIGLTILFYKEVFNKKLPYFEQDYLEISQTKENEAIITNFTNDGFKQITEPVFGDLILFEIFGFKSHLGIFIDNKLFLHSVKGTDSCVETFQNIKWGNRFDSFWRPVEIN